MKIEDNTTESRKRKKFKGNKSISTCSINPNTQNNYVIDCNPHSPKIKNNLYRCNSQPKLFSLNDIKNQYLSKGTSLPMQYNRQLYPNINKILSNNNSNTNTISNNENNDIKEINDNIKKSKKLRKSKSQGNIDSNYYNDYRIQSALICRKDKSYLPLCSKNSEIKNNNKNKRTKRDILMPTGYELYEKNLKIFNENYVHNNYIKNNENKYVLIRKLNKLKQNKSDIFFMKEREREN